MMEEDIPGKNNEGHISALKFISTTCVLHGFWGPPQAYIGHENDSCVNFWDLKNIYLLADTNHT